MFGWVSAKKKRYEEFNPICLPKHTQNLFLTETEVLERKMREK